MSDENYNTKVLFTMVTAAVLGFQILMFVRLIWKLYCERQSSINKNRFQEIVSIICFFSCIISSLCDIIQIYICYQNDWVIFTIKSPINILMILSDTSTFFGFGCIAFTWYLRIYIPFRNTKYQISLCYHVLFWLLVLFCFTLQMIMNFFYIFTNNNNVPTNIPYKMNIYQKYNMLGTSILNFLLGISLLYLLITKLRKIYDDINILHNERNLNNQINSSIQISQNTTINTALISKSYIEHETTFNTETTTKSITSFTVCSLFTYNLRNNI